MKTPLTLQRLFLGLNGMAIEGKELNIQVIPEYDKSGKLLGTKWNLKIDNDIDSDNERIIIKDFLAGYRIDNYDYNVQMKFYDASGRFPRQIADRISSVQSAKKKKIRKTDESAFFQLLMIIRDYYNYFDEDVISILQNIKILKAKCNISYPLLIKIPDTITTNDDLLKHFYLLTLLNPKTLKLYKNKFYLLGKNNDINGNEDNNENEDNSADNKIIIIENLVTLFQDDDVFNIIHNYIDDQFIDSVKNSMTLKNKIRYWKKVLTLNNGKRYWISNHIFNNSIIPFKELLTDLTGVNITINSSNNKSSINTSIKNASINDTSINDNSSNTNTIKDSDNKIDVKIDDQTNLSKKNNLSALDNLVSNAFGFNF